MNHSAFHDLCINTQITEKHLVLQYVTMYFVEQQELPKWRLIDDPDALQIRMYFCSYSHEI
jgi:hypothetical protein